MYNHYRTCNRPSYRHTHTKTGVAVSSIEHCV